MQRAVEVATRTKDLLWMSNLKTLLTAKLEEELPPAIQSNLEALHDAVDCK